MSVLPQTEIRRTHAEQEQDREVGRNCQEYRYSKPRDALEEAVLEPPG